MLNTISGLLSGAGGAATDYESIATSTVGAGGAASISFTSIPSTYTHLQIRTISRNVSALGGFSTLRGNFNSDTASNYSRHNLEGDGSSVSASGSASSTYFANSRSANGSVTSNVFGVGIIDILDYANTNKYKTVRILTGVDDNSAGRVNFHSGLWMSTSAINTISLYDPNANIAEYSSFALYGIK